MQSFKKLRVWRQAHQLVLSVYRETRTFPEDERYGLTSQLRRGAASVPANIAEGVGRGGDREFARFLKIALGSAFEVEYHLLLSNELTYLDSTTYEEMEKQVQTVKRMLINFLRRLDPMFVPETTFTYGQYETGLEED